MSVWFGVIAAVTGSLFVFTKFMAWRLARAYPPQGSFVDVDGGRLHIVVAGETPGRANVLLLHGASGNQADMMVALGQRLTDLGFRVIAVDRPGSGWSSRPSGYVSPAMQAKMIREGIGKLGFDQAIVVGHSLAGATARQFAMDQPDFTQGLVLISPVTHPWPGGIAWFYHVAAAPWIGPVFTQLLTLPLGFLSLNSAIRHVFAPCMVPSGFATNTGAALVLRPKAFRANAQDMAGLYEFICAQVSREAEIKVPTAIVSGEQDAVVYTSIHSVASAKAIAGARLRILAPMGHSPHHCDPEAVIAEILGVAARAGV
ncbi:MAG: alpha/beta hydrolase [Hyphomicrobiales bacterium]|nr:alpha/beta hydrolase [Hyphomicrobiales bacterium]MDE2115598.1 alpha/beta hydrolase [Hyphomicrobiales bacterium]